MTKLISSDLTMSPKQTHENNNLEILANIPDIEKKKNWFHLLKPIINARLKCANPSAAPLITTLSSNESVHNWKTIKHLIEFCLKNTYNCCAIFSRISRSIQPNNTYPDNIIDSMFAELYTIPYLVHVGFKNITYRKENSVDFTAKLNEVLYTIEVKYICKPSFKTQTKLTNLNVNCQGAIYQLGAHKLINKFKSSYDSKLNQSAKSALRLEAKQIIFLITDIEETDPFWLNDQPYQEKHPIQAFVDECTVPTIVLGAGQHSYISVKLRELLLPYDRQEYIRIRDGVDHDFTTHEIIEAKLKETFFRSINRAQDTTHNLSH